MGHSARGRSHFLLCQERRLYTQSSASTRAGSLSTANQLPAVSPWAFPVPPEAALGKEAQPPWAVRAIFSGLKCFLSLCSDYKAA